MPRGVYDRSKATKGAADDAGVEETADAPVVEPDTAVTPDDPVPADPAVDGDSATPPDSPTPADEPDLCPLCFPDGWPTGVTSAGCVHGQWERAL